MKKRSCGNNLSGMENGGKGENLGLLFLKKKKLRIGFLGFKPYLRSFGGFNGKRLTSREYLYVRLRRRLATVRKAIR